MTSADLTFLHWPGKFCIGCQQQRPFSNSLTVWHETGFQSNLFMASCLFLPISFSKWSMTGERIVIFGQKELAPGSVLTDIQDQLSSGYYPMKVVQVCHNIWNFLLHVVRINIYWDQYFSYVDLKPRKNSKSWTSAHIGHFSFPWRSGECFLPSDVNNACRDRLDGLGSKKQLSMLSTT